MVEIISSLDNPGDVARKISDYLKFGVRLAWLIDPYLKIIRKFTPDHPDGILHEAEIIKGDPVLPGWSMPLAELFGAAK